MTYNFIEGEVLLVDKPFEWTSFDVVNKLRCLIKHHLGIKKIKIGHAGTLDPLATGLLIICTGKFTKKINEFQALNKEYTGTFFLGATTPSSDLETEVNNTFNISHIKEDLILSTAKNFTGKMSQLPPVYSAKKIDGERAYESARKGIDLKMKSREVSINEFEITRIALPEVNFRVVCSKGTYIRSLAKDFGEAMNTGAYLSALRRTKIGAYRLENATNLQLFEKSLLTL
jgi:tRNA pseudouridine55 synthase